MTRLNRRRLFKAAAGMGVFGATASHWFPTLANRAAAESTTESAKPRKRHCILLWMPGGPTQTDTFDMKPDHENGGEFKEIATSVPGLRFSEHLPKLAKHAEHLAIVRSLSTKEGDHGRGTYLMRTGETPMGPVNYPPIGAALGKTMPSDQSELPNYISIGPFRAFNRDAFGSGFLGAKYAPLVVGATDSGNAQLGEDGYARLQVDSLKAPVSKERMKTRLEMWERLQAAYLADHPDSPAALAHHQTYQRTVNMMSREAGEAFDLSQEDTTLREAYGKGVFGQGCLLARRLIERGVSFVEVSLGTTSGGIGWDTHANNFNAVKDLSTELDAGWATLIEDLKLRGMLEDTTILWMGEFGRTPKINQNAGRDHFPAAWTCVFAGGGIAGGQAYGKTSKDGMQVEENKVGVKDVLATLCEAVGMSPLEENYTDNGRPIPLVEHGEPIKDLLS